MEQPYNSGIANQPYLDVTNCDLKQTILPTENIKTIFPTTDISLIKAALELENIYDNMAYDGSPSLQEYVPTGVWLLLLGKNDLVCGFINLNQMNNVMWNCHIYIRPYYRGNGSEEWGIQAAQYISKHGAKKILAITPYESAKKYAERVGFTNVGVLSSSIRKNGQLLNQWLLELGV